MRFAIILGTRPEIIKMSPIIRACERLKLDYFILHTGQHYSYNMDRIFFEQLELPEPKYNLNVGSGTHAEETGRMLIGIENILMHDKPEVVLVEGDTNTVLAGALTATKLGLKVGHVEAGLRSYDRTMPEEINRILTDYCSDYLFAPTAKSRNILMGEGIPKEKIYVTGNTIVDAIHQNLEIANKTRSALNDLHLKPNNYFLVTAHRQENVDNKTRFRDILKGLERIANEFDIPIIYPIHPRARKRLDDFDLEPNGIELIDPIDFLSFLQLESNAKLVLTDSGGVQEETCILKVPCVTLRENTERPETLDVGSNILAGTKPIKVLKRTTLMLEKNNDWQNPFGEGNTGNIIIDILRNQFK